MQSANAISIWGTLLMEQVPENKLARVTSLDFFGSTGLVPLGYALTAGLSQALRPETLVVAEGGDHPDPGLGVQRPRPGVGSVLDGAERGAAA